MKAGEQAILKMEKMLCREKETDDFFCSCTVIGYDKEQESIYLHLDGREVSELSLDGIYVCEITGEKEDLTCTGRVRERYHNELGKVVRFQVTDGFYQKNKK